MSVSKGTYQKFHNRPRPDFVVYLIKSTLISKFYDSYKSLRNDQKNPAWWVLFVKECRAKSIKEIVSTYKINEIEWVCSCRAYLESRFLFCKHLVHDGGKCPQYRDFVWYQHTPFLKIKREGKIHFLQLDASNYSHKH